MAEFVHSHCNNSVAMVVDLKLIVATLKTNIEAFTPGVMDLRMFGEDGTLKMVEVGGNVVPSWYCTTCKRPVQVEEIVATCFGCGNFHPLVELVATVHTAPVRMDCYSSYRGVHPEEQLPERPKTRPILDLIKSIPVKL